VTLIVDSGPLVALGDRRDPWMPAVKHLLESEAGPLVIPMTVATEVDHLLARRGGPAAREAFIDDIASGRFQVECLTSDEWPEMLTLARRYADLAPGLADLSIVVLASRYGTTRVATFDARDFAVMRPLTGAPAFEILPSGRDLA
jgi:hypothetical protein